MTYSLFARAEYRVFLLQIQNTETQEVRELQSTLDPEQYQNVYPLKPQERIWYTQTWRCPGRTDYFKPHCPNPYQREPAEAQD